MYKVRDPIEVEGGKLPDGEPFTVKRYYVTWGGSEPNRSGDPYRESPYVLVWADGSISACCGGKELFLYDDQWRGVVAAVNRAMNDKEEDRRQRHEAWFRENGDSLQHFGYAVDRSINAARQIIETADLRITHQLEIELDGRWLHLCRADLKDDVCTFRYEDIENPEAARRHYLSLVGYGARVDAARFAVIDRYSDG